MIQERINKLKRESELAEAHLKVNFKKIGLSSSNNNLANSIGISSSNLIKYSVPALAIISQLTLGKNNKIYSLSKNLNLIGKIVSALK